MYVDAQDAETQLGGALTATIKPSEDGTRPSRLRPRELQHGDLVSIEVRDVNLIAVDNH